MNKIISTLIFILLLVIAANATVITVEQGIVSTNWTAGGASASLKIYTNRTFVSSTGANVTAGSASAPNVTVSCTVASATVTCPQFTIHSTEDSSTPSALYTAILHDSNGAIRQITLTNFRVPSVPTITNWQSLRTYNTLTIPNSTSPSVLMLRSTYDNDGNGIIDAIDSISNLSISGLGDVTVSSPTAGQVLKFNGSNWVNDTGGVAYESLVSEYTGFADAVETIGITPSVLVVNQTEIVNSAVTIPDNIFIKVIPGATLSESGTGSITFEGEGLSDAPREQIFFGFEPGDIKFTGTYPDVIYPEWFGVKANDASAAAANTAAMKVLLASFRSVTFEGFADGATIRFSNGIYYFAQTLSFDDNVRVKGEGNNTILQFPGNTGGVRFNHAYTQGADTPIDDASFTASGVNLASSGGGWMTITLPVSLPAEYAGGTWYMTGGDLASPIGGGISSSHAGGTSVQILITLPSFAAGTSAVTGASFRAERARTAAYSSLKDLIIRGTLGANTHNVTISGLTVTRNSGDSFIDAKSYGRGNTFSIGGIPYVIKSITNGNTIEIYSYILKLIHIAPGTYATNYSDMPAHWAGATIKINNVDYTIETVYGGSIVLAGGANPTNVSYGEITAFPSITADARFNIWHGIDMRVQLAIDNVTVRGFPGAGLALQSTAQPSLAPDTAPNANFSLIQNLRVHTNAGAGVLATGYNSNTNAFHQIDCQNNGIAIYDGAFHANAYYNIHVLFDRHGVMAGMDPSAPQGAHFFKPYIEDAMPQFRLEGRAMIIGGTYAEGKSGGTEMVPLNNRWMGSPYEARDSYAYSHGTAGRGNIFSAVGGHPYRAFLQFGQMGSDNYRQKMYYLMNWNTGYYGFSYYPHETSGNPIGVAYDAVLEFTTEDAPIGGGQIRFPKGAYHGIDGTQRRWQYVSAVPTSGTVSLGDIFWNNSSGAGVSAPIGWIVSTAGTIGSDAVLSPFGNFSGTSAAVNPPEIAAGAAHEFTVTVNGATTNDVVTCNMTGGTVDAGLVWSSFVSAANTATIRLANITASPVDGAARDWKCKIIN